MEALQVDPKTGYLFAPSLSTQTFSPALKTKFIDEAICHARAGLWPNLQAIADAMGLTVRTITNHLKIDDRLREQWQEVIEIIENRLVDTMVTNGQKPNGYMDRITWLRAHNPGKWNPEYRLQVNSDDSKLKGLHSDAIEGFIVEKEPNNGTTHA